MPLEFASLKGWGNLLQGLLVSLFLQGTVPYCVISLVDLWFGRLSSHQPLSTPSFSLQSNPATSSLPCGLSLIFNHHYNCVTPTCKTLALTFMQGYLRHSYQSSLLWQFKSTSQGSSEAENKSSLPLPWIHLSRGAEGEPYRGSARPNIFESSFSYYSLSSYPNRR